MNEVLVCLRIVVVIACLCVAAAIATPKGRIPLALRGVLRVLRNDLGTQPGDVSEPVVSRKRRIVAFLLVLVAVIVVLDF